MTLEIATAAASAKQTLTLVKALLGANTQVKINEVAIEIQQKVIDLQTSLADIRMEYDELIEVKREVERQLAEYRDWENEKSKYEPFELSQGFFVFRPKPEFQPTEPPYNLCPNCFGKGKKSPLQRLNANRATVSCVECKLEHMPEQERSKKPFSGFNSGMGGIR